ncbi:MAG: hypothetical protein ACJA1A_000897 [Saprospiraceae bacterium]|jgi:hypothetical protein
MITGNNPFAKEISHYSDNRILEIIQNSNDYAAQLVNRCRREAENRNLKISNVLFVDNSFCDDVKGYSDAKLISMILGGIECPPKLMAACKMEVQSRNLSTAREKVAGVFRRDEIMEVQERLKINESIAEIKSNLISRGLSDDDALKLIDKAINSKELRVIAEIKSEESVIGVFTAMSIILMLVRWYINSRFD